MSKLRRELLKQSMQARKESDSSVAQKMRESEASACSAKQPNQAAQVSSPTKQLDQAAQVSSPTEVIAEISSPSKQPNQAAQPSSLPHQSDQSAYLSSLPEQPNTPKVRLEPKEDFFTPAQQAVLRYFQLNGSHVASYDIISKDSKVPRGTVRQIIDKMISLRILDRKPWRQGRSCGLEFYFYGTSFNSKHPNQAPQPSMAFQHPNQASQNPSLIQIDRKIQNLSISQERVELTWPTLAASGFGERQINQIGASLEELGKSTEGVVEGLDYAEWELENGKMRDKDGNPVADPCAWVFRSLSRTGTYRRPKGYMSIQDQNELDKVEEEKERAQALARSRLEARLARSKAWFDSLSMEERKTLRKGKFGVPDANWILVAWEAKGEPE